MADTVTSSALAQVMFRADRAMSQLYGRPVRGAAGWIVLGATSQPFTLRGGLLYVLTVVGGDCLFAIDAPADSANVQIMVAGTSMALTPGAAGREPVLNVIQGPAVGGTLYVTAWEDVA